jgi:hypothetical protein
MGRVAAQAATYAIELYGPQAHSYTWDEFAARYKESFGEALRAEGAAERNMATAPLG